MSIPLEEANYELEKAKGVISDTQQYQIKLLKQIRDILQETLDKM